MQSRRQATMIWQTIQVDLLLFLMVRHDDFVLKPSLRWWWLLLDKRWAEPTTELSWWSEVSWIKNARNHAKLSMENKKRERNSNGRDSEFFGNTFGVFVSRYLYVVISVSSSPNSENMWNSFPALMLANNWSVAPPSNRIRLRQMQIGH